MSIGLSFGYSRSARIIPRRSLRLRSEEDNNFSNSSMTKSSENLFRVRRACARDLGISRLEIMPGINSGFSRFSAIVKETLLITDPSFLRNSISFSCGKMLLL